MSDSKMGRPKKYNTEEERLEAKKKQDSETQKRIRRKRRERYNSDPEYREKILDRQRRSYNRRKGKGSKTIAPNSNAVEFATLREVHILRSIVTRNCLTVEEMANFLDVTSKTVNQWIRQGKFPKARFSTHIANKKVSVYTVDQADALAKILGNNLRGKTRFSLADKVTIAELSSVV